jgi:hypothetical protein
LIPAGHELVAADFDAYENATAALASYVPVWFTSGVAPVLGNGTIAGRFRKVGLDTFIQVMLTMGTTTTYGTGFFAFDLAGTANAAATDALGSARLFDTSAGTHYSATCVVGAGVNFAKLLFGSSGEITGTVPFTFATGDVVALNVRLQA